MGQQKKAVAEQPAGVGAVHPDGRAEQPFGETSWPYAPILERSCPRQIAVPRQVADATVNLDAVALSVRPERLDRSVIAAIQAARLTPPGAGVLLTFDEAQLPASAELEMLVDAELDLVLDEDPQQAVAPHERDHGPADRGDEAEPEPDEERGEQLGGDRRPQHRGCGVRGLVERAARAGDEQREVSGEGELEEDQGLDLCLVELQPLFGETSRPNVSITPSVPSAVETDSTRRMSHRTGRGSSQVLS